MDLSEKFFLMVCHTGCETSGIQTVVKETQVHGYTNPAQNKEVSAATGVPQGVRTGAGQRSCALPGVVGSQLSTPFWGHVPRAGKVPLCPWPVLCCSGNC